MRKERAQTIALNALGWLVQNDELLPVFLGSSGASIEDLRQNASDAAFQASVLDFLLMDDAWVIAACDAQDIAHDQLYVARHSLPGAEQVHWT